jgi:membrane protein YqaA with SNARE-associated domain
MELLPIYFSLFVVSFLAATLVPAQSEAVLLGLLMTESYEAWLLLLVASAGNVLGSCANWLVGLFLTRFEGRKWFPLKREGLRKAEVWYHRYGRWSLLLSWVPVIGDPLTVVAGVLREPFAVFLALVTVAKVGRYLAIYGLQQGWLS